MRSHLQDIAAGDDVPRHEMLEDHAGRRADVERVDLDEAARAGWPVGAGLADGVGAYGAGLAAGDAWSRGFTEDATPFGVREDAPDGGCGDLPAAAAQ